MSDRSTMFLLFPSALLIVVFMIFAMKYFVSARTARLRLTSDDAYRDLAARAVKFQEESAAALSSLKGSVSEIHVRLERVEKVLKEVE